MNESSMMKPIGIMPNHLDVREITFTNLLLLDFHPTEMESKYPVVFNRDMFALPNKKAMEVIMHFLFTRLHPQLAYEEFRDCWPVRDKVQEQQFRKVCFNWVSRIQKEDTEARLPRVVQSLFHSPGGDRFYSFLHHFSLYVLVRVMQRDHGKIVSIPTFPTKTVHNQSFTRVMSKALEAHYVVLKKRFLEFAQYAVEVEHHWKDFAVESTKEFRSLVKKKRELERQIRQLGGPTAGVKTDYQEEVEALKRTQNLQKVRDLWAGIEEFYSVQSPQRKIVDSVLQGEANKHQIDASDIQPRVPDLLLRDCEKEIRMRNIEDTFVGGKVNLLSLIQLWNLSLKKIKEQIHQGPIPSFEEVSPTVRSALHTHHAHLTNSKSVSNAIQETIPAMKEHINQMKSQCYKPLEHNHGGAPKAHVSFNLGLGLVPPTPPVSFAASDTPVAERITSFHDTLKLSPDAVSTPDVIQAWTKSVRGKQTAGNQVSGSKKEFKRTEPSRLPRPKQHSPDQHQPAKSTEKKKKKKPSEIAQPQKTSLTEQRKHHVTPKGKGGKDVHVPSAGLRSQKILADQIAEAVAMDHSSSPSVSSSEPSSRASTPQAQALEDPIGAFGQDAFQPRDRIARTPAKTPSGYPLPSHSQTREENRSVRQPMTDSKPGRLLETILDQSYEQNTPQSARTRLSNTATTSLHHTPRLQHQTVLDRSGILLTPQSVKSALFKEAPSPLHTESIRNQSGMPTPSSAGTELFKEASLLGDSEETYPAAFLSLLGVQTTPNLLDTSLFGGTPSPLPSHLGLEQTPTSTALFQGASPQLSAFLLPWGAMDRSSMEPKPEETSPKFSLSPVDYEALSQSHVQLTPTSSKAMSFSDTPQHDRFVPHQGSVHSHSGVPQTRTTLLQETSLQHTVGSPQRDVDTTELLERFNKVKQPAVEYLQRERDTSPRHHNTLNSSAMHPMPTPTQHYSGPLSTERVLDRSNVKSTPMSARTETNSVTPQSYNTLSPHQKTVLSGSGKVHSTKAAFSKETSVAIATSSPGYEVDTRALIERLNKIKQTQQSASGSFFYTPPTKPLESQTNGHTPRVGTAGGEVSDTSLLASRLDQIRQAQKSQQVTPGANTDGDLSTSRPSEPALLTPLTPSSRDTHSEDDAQNGLTKFTFYSPQPSPSLPGSPFPSPNDRSLQLTPFKNDQEFSSPFQRAALSPSSEVGLAGGDLGLVEGLQWETDTPSLPERRTKTGLLTDGSSPFVTHSSPLSYSISTPLLVNSVQRQHVDSRVAEAQQFTGSTVHDGRDVSPLFILTSPQVDEGTLSNGHVTPSKHDGLLSPVIGQLIDLE